MNSSDKIVDLVSDALRATGRDVLTASQELRAYAAERLAHLALAVGQPGYARAVEAEAQNVALRSVQELVSAADAADVRTVNLVAGAIDLGARILAGGAA